MEPTSNENEAEVIDASIVASEEDMSNDPDAKEAINCVVFREVDYNEFINVLNSLEVSGAKNTAVVARMYELIGTPLAGASLQPE